MPDDALVGRQLGGFEVLGVLGSGAFATVYRARQLRLGRDVALKVLDPLVARNPDSARRFDREGWAAAGLDHPCIVPVHEAGEQDGIWYLAMRLVEGRTLADELDEGPPSRPRASEVVKAVGDALDHAHSRDVLHRDVKPANILVQDDGRVFLSDFGISATAHQVGVYTLGAIGTLSYMAPEQARVGEADFRSDLYSLGCVAYECVAGRPPFVRRDQASLLYAHAHDPVPPVDDARLDAFYAKALAKEPDERFQSGAELAAAFDAALGLGGVETVVPDRPAAAVAPVAPTGGRRRVPLIVAGALFLVVVAVATFLGTRGGGGNVTAANNVKGPAAVTDADGARYDLPPGWEIRSVQSDGDKRLTGIFEGEQPAVQLTVAPAGGDTAVGLAARTPDPSNCAKENQTAERFGRVAAVRCLFRPQGDVSAPAVTVHYAVAGGHDWVVLVKPGISATKLARFVASLRLPT